MQELDLYKWVNEARRGEQTAWTFLYNFFHPGLLSKALNICGNTAEARDAVQDSFMIAFLKLDQLKDEQAFPAWITQILTRRCYRTNQESKGSGYTDSLTNEGADLDFEKKLDDVYSKHRLFDSLESLPEHLKTTLLLRYFSKNNSYEDISAILGVPVGTIRSRLNKARISLAENWLQKCTEGKTLEQSAQWNGFYYQVFEGYMFNPQLRDKLIGHMDKQIQVQLTSKKQLTGRNYIEQSIEEDVIHGIKHGDIQVNSCGSISVIEFGNINNEEFPDHCPRHTTLVAFRDKMQIVRMHLYDSPR